MRDFEIVSCTFCKKSFRSQVPLAAKSGRTFDFLCKSCGREFQHTFTIDRTTPRIIETQGAESLEACPKCRGTLKSHFSECPKCGLILSRIEGVPIELVGKVPLRIGKMWSECRSDLLNTTKHDEFIDLCFRLKQLNFAREQYAGLLKELGSDANVRRYLDKTLSL